MKNFKAILIAFVSFLISLYVDIPGIILGLIGKLLIESNTPILKPLGQVILFIFVYGPPAAVSTLMGSVGLAFLVWKKANPKD